MLRNTLVLKKKMHKLVKLLPLLLLQHHFFMQVHVLKTKSSKVDTEHKAKQNKKMKTTKNSRGISRAETL